MTTVVHAVIENVLPLTYTPLGLAIFTVAASSTGNTLPVGTHITMSSVRVMLPVPVPSTPLLSV